ncbi:MAG: TolC family protein [Lentimicrobium sp.]|nr:TolC family protein [Lentimicrobium sp.]
MSVIFLNQVNLKMNKLNYKFTEPVIVVLVLLCIICAGSFHAGAQVFTAGDAVITALENNYNIRIARLGEEELRNNLTLGNAGFLPGVGLNAGQSNSVTNSRQEYLSGQINERENAKSNSFSTSVNMNWTIFDGFRMFNNYSMLSNQLKAGEYSTRLAVENTISQVLNNYYNIVQLNQKVKVFEKAVSLGEERTVIAREMLMIGSGSRLDLLQAEVDLNTDKSQLLDLQERISEASIALNQLLARDAGITFAVEDTFSLMPGFEYERLLKKMETENVSLLMSNLDIELAMNQLKDIRGSRLPGVGVNLGYNFNVQASESGFVKSGRTSGLNYGITASMNLFDGFNLNRQQKNAKIRIEVAEMQKQSYLSEFRAALLSTYTAYNYRLKMVEFEKLNLQTANINFDIAGERYRLGELSGIEYREAQKNLLLANERLINAQFEVRLLEIMLLQISGSILPE